MRHYIYLILTVFLFLLGNNDLLATHNRAGEIQIQQIGPLTLRVTVITYTKASSVLADRDSLLVMWGDGTSQWVRRSNGNGSGEILPNDTKFNLYTAEHTYPGRATYTISMMDPNRNGGILNVNPPNSESVPFYIESVYTFLNPQFQGFNNSAILLQPPIDFGCVGKRFIHNPSAFDPDGDSLAFELVVPAQDVGTPVPRYSFPNQIGAGGNNVISLNKTTGDFIWETPQRAGEYNIAIRIKEYRGGQLINSFVRDLQIEIRTCDNQPPQIQTRNEICVIAGEVLSIPVTITDPDRNPTQRVRVEMRGGPFVQEFSPAEQRGPRGYTNQPLQAEFYWETSCEHISPEFYNVTIRAVDDFYDTTGLAALQTIRIKVIAPAPENLSATPRREDIMLEWDAPYACDTPRDGSFRGFTVWRKLGNQQITLDTCRPDLASQGYQPIAFAVNEQVANKFVYTDTDVAKGRTYCYRVTAEFAQFTQSGNPFNTIESLPSNGICAQLLRDVPLLTNVSVLETDPANGRILVSWVPPNADALDTIRNPGPYRYVLERGEGFSPSNFEPLQSAVFDAATFSELRSIDTFIDTGLNTSTTPYTYRINFFIRGDINNSFGFSEPASSIFLSAEGDDKVVRLSWQERVPWDNYNYLVIKENSQTGGFDTIASVSEPFYEDNEVMNGTEYCYLIESEGSYRLNDLNQEFFNLSQLTCAIPVDTSAPCPPTLSVKNICNEPDPSIFEDRIENTLSWAFDHPDCMISDDLDAFNIYFTSSPSEPLSLVATLDRDARSFVDVPESIFGCYALTAIDTLGNESQPTPLICVDICAAYELPNAFTPNGDGFNDLFIPRENRFVASVEFYVYNRWGNLVFKTNNPTIEWDGNDLNGNPLPESTYYYKAVLSFIGLSPAEAAENANLSGFIELVR